MHIAQKFEALLEMYPHPDGRRWSGQEIDEATGVVSRSYVTNLRKGRIENPGYEKLAAMAKAMGFAPEVWFEDGLSKERSIGQAEVSYGVAGRLEHLFEVVRNPKTGEPYTNAEVARMTLGDLSEEEVERIRTAAVSDPRVGQVVALAGVFGVETSYLLNRSEPPLDGELVDVLRDETARETVREIARLSKREKRLVLGIVRQFGGQAKSNEQSKRVRKRGAARALRLE
jgi:transcriptional regulator with XRE-family HTH domain